MYYRRAELRNQPHLRAPHSGLLHHSWWSPSLSLRWGECGTNYRTAVEAEVRGLAEQNLGGGAAVATNRWSCCHNNTVNTICLFIFNYVYVHVWVYWHRYCGSQKHLSENACRELNSGSLRAQYTPLSYHLFNPHQLFPKLHLAFHPQEALSLYYKWSKIIYHLHHPWFAFLTTIRRSEESSGTLPKDLGLGVYPKSPQS